jgi:hypothetical protein
METRKQWNISKVLKVFRIRGGKLFYKGCTSKYFGFCKLYVLWAEINQLCCPTTKAGIGWVPGLMHIILATWEAEIGRITI